MSNTPIFPRPDHDYQGMTLRDWFAGQALAGYTTDPNTENDNQYDIAEWAYSFADAMLAYRDN